MAFKDLQIGDMFNINSGRFVKISDSRAICVMSSIHSVGKVITFLNDTEVIVLYSQSILK